MNTFTTLPTTHPAVRRPKRRKAARSHPRALTALTALVGIAATGALSLSPAAAAAPSQPAVHYAAAIDCPSAACRRVVTGTPGSQRGVALDGSGHAYLDTAAGVLYEIDLATGAKREVTKGLGDSPGVALDGAGQAIVTSWSQGTLWSVDLSTGRKDKITAGLGNAFAVALDGTGHAYVTSWNQGTLWSVDLRTGAKYEVAKVTSNTGLGLDGQGHAYVSSTQGVLYQIDLRTGAKSEVATNLGDAPGLALDDAGNAYVGNRGGIMHQVNLQTGATRQLASGLGDVWGAAVDHDGNAYASNAAGTLWRLNAVAEPSNPSTATVQRARTAQGSPGDAWLYPSVLAINTGERAITSQKVTVTVAPGLELLENSLTVWDSSTDREKTTDTCVRSRDRRTLSCNNVSLDLKRGQKAGLWTAVGVRDSATAGRAEVTYTLGAPAFATGTTYVSITD
ncbi:hypothetical protein ACIRL0_24345 [Streptomyces sp. NPDC102365]|uniref:hypothetical protein n=1 Tax=Streptomyces sp. NPDC102365 TaxID=3366162 RepID=UPI00380878E8